jgi:D-alanyl-D-alanine carboxypeptidase
VPFRLKAVVAASVGLLVLSVSGCAVPDPVPTDAPTAASTGLPVPEQTGGGASTSAPTETPSTGAGNVDADIDDPASLAVVVNKTRPLDPDDYAASDLVTVPVPHTNPPMLRKEASAAIVDMFADYTDETGLEMQSISAYRSYSAQVRVYNNWVASLGQEGADLTSARPGFSEHQTGLAMDIDAKPSSGCALDQCFADTPQGIWLAKNAWKYGFVLRYPEGLTDVTGYEFEPWHYRYIGIDLAKQYHDSGATTLEGFFGLPDAPDYEN